MAMTRAKFRCNPRRSLVLFGAFATKPSVAWVVRLLGPSRLMRYSSVHFITMHSGHKHERTACTGCGPGA
eukprot:scaffold5929_cov72-Phaeocystis_antarctica.AAC.5